jgi:DNA repair protein RadD
MELRAYQTEGIDRLRESLRSGKKRPLLVMATGSGKSIVMSKIIQSVVENGKKVLWIVHRRNLVSQMKETLLDMFGVEAGVIMAGVEPDLDKPVQLTTIQSYSRRLNLDTLRYNQFFVRSDVVMADEAHRCVSKSYRDVLDLYEDKIIIGCTATPCRADSRPLGDVFDDLVPVSSVKELTRDGFLAPARYFVPKHIELDGVKMAMGDYQVKSLAEKTNQKHLIGDIVENWLKIGENRKTLVFCVNVKHAIAVCDAFNAAGVPAAHLNARSSDDERDEVFERMNDGRITVITNVAIYQEGLDVPDVSCVVMARPTKSLGLYRQCCGRGLRPSDSAEDCLILDHGNVIETHGLLDWDMEWSLDGKERAWSKPTREQTKKLVRCRACGLTFEGSRVCPDCGTECRSFGKKIETIDAELQELKPEKGSVEEKRVFLGMLKKWVPRQKNPNPKRIIGAFRGRYGVFPHSSYKDVAAIEPDKAFLNYMKSQQIRYIKRKEKEKQIADSKNTDRLIREYQEKKHATGR